MTLLQPIVLNSKSPFSLCSMCDPSNALYKLNKKKCKDVVEADICR